MNILRNNPKKWSLQRETLPDGTFRVLSGYGGDGHFYYHKQTNPVTDVPNIIFEAEIRATKHSRGRSSAVFEFEDKDGIHKYQTGCAGMIEIIREIQADHIMVIDGWLSGAFTFVKQGNEIYLMPYTDAM